MHSPTVYVHEVHLHSLTHTHTCTHTGESLRHSTVLEPQQQTEGVRSGSEDREHQEATERDVDTNVRVKERKLKASLLECPALKFITRKDLYTFLKSSGVSHMTE